MKKLFTALAMVGALTIAGPAAAATNSATDAYGGQGGNVLGQTDVAGDTSVAGATAGGGNGGGTGEVQGASAGSAPVAAATASESVSSGSLPFTGLDVTLMALGGLMLLGLGFALRRSAKPSTQV